MYLFPIVLVPITSIFVLKSDKSNHLIYDSLEQKKKEDPARYWPGQAEGIKKKGPEIKEVFFTLYSFFLLKIFLLNPYVIEIELELLIKFVNKLSKDKIYRIQ